jgi:hypothetical protein
VWENRGGSASSTVLIVEIHGDGPEQPAQACDHDADQHGQCLTVQTQSRCAGVDAVDGAAESGQAYAQPHRPPSPWHPLPRHYHRRRSLSASAVAQRGGQRRRRRRILKAITPATARTATGSHTAIGTPDDRPMAVSRDPINMGDAPSMVTIATA